MSSTEGRRVPIRPATRLTVLAMSLAALSLTAPDEFTRAGEPPVPIAPRHLYDLMPQHEDPLGFDSIVVTDLRFDPDGRFLLARAQWRGTGAGDDTPSLSLWSLAHRRDLLAAPNKKLPERAMGAAYAVSYSPDGTTVASGDAPYVHLWNTATGDRRKSWKPEGLWVKALAFQPDGKRVVLSSQDLKREDEGARRAPKESFVSLWDLATDRPIAKQGLDNEAITWIGYDAPGEHIAAVSEGDGFHVWDRELMTQQVIQPERGPAPEVCYVRGVEQSPDRRWVVSVGEGDGWLADSRGFITVRDLESGDDLLHADLPFRAFSVAISADQTIIATAGGNDGLDEAIPGRYGRGYLWAWDTATWTALYRLRLEGDMLSCVAISPRGEVIATGGWDGETVFRNGRTGDELWSYSMLRGQIGAIAFDPTGRTCAIGEQQRVISVWDVAGLLNLAGQ
jgi:WD40 repeat protein